jgi:plastocyanin
VACGDDDDSDADAPAANAGGSTITISNFQFSPGSAAGGATVTVKNDDSTAHTVTSDTAGQFDTGNVNAGAEATFAAPSAAGNYPFHCEIHPTNMKGTLTVTA